MSNRVRQLRLQRESPTIAIATRRSSGKQIDDTLDGCVSAVIRGFESAGWLVAGGGAVVEAAMGERTAEPFVEEEE